MTSPHTTVGLLHPGQMGAAVATQFDRHATRVLWCPRGRGPATRRRAREADLVSATLEELAEGSDIVVSLVPPAAAEETAERIFAAGFTGMFVEANAVRPERVHSIAEQAREAGALLVDGCVIGPPPPGERPTRLYLAGEAEHCTRIAELFVSGAVEPHYLGPEVGRASALKTSQAIAQKAMRALSALAYALADRYGVTDELAEAVHDWPHPAADPGKLPGIAARAWRWSSELSDVSHALDDAGLPNDLTLAAADLFTRWNGLKDVPDASLDQILNSLHQKREDPL